MGCNPIVARPTGFEPVTPSLEGSCSIRLSYGRVRLRLARFAEKRNRLRGRSGRRNGFLLRTLLGGRLAGVEGDDETAERLAQEAKATDPQAVEDVLQELDEDAGSEHDPEKIREELGSDADKQ